MTDTRKIKARRERRQKLGGKSSHASFYGGLKSKNELYFQMHLCSRKPQRAASLLRVSGLTG